jgi:Predicted Zn peptidase
MSGAVGISAQRRKVIAERARFLQLSLLNDYHRLHGVQPSNPLDVINPVGALESLGYSIAQGDLGQDLIEGRLVDVAGHIDARHRVVALSTKMGREEQFFTAAHELGHAVLHPYRHGLHRDRPVKGPSMRKSSIEAEADYFASCFLMPEKQVRRRFEWNFLCDSVQLTNEVAFALSGTDEQSLRSRVRSVRDLTRMLSECVYFNGNPLIPLKRVFRVSTDAMAIRLEELGLASL